MTFGDYKASHHFLKRIESRGISLKQVVDCIESPKKRIQLINQDKIIRLISSDGIVVIANYQNKALITAYRQSDQYIRCSKKKKQKEKKSDFYKRNHKQIVDRKKKGRWRDIGII